jgi:hypothetical protein
MPTCWPPCLCLFVSFAVARTCTVCAEYRCICITTASLFDGSYGTELLDYFFCMQAILDESEAIDVLIPRAKGVDLSCCDELGGHPPSLPFLAQRLLWNHTISHSCQAGITNGGCWLRDYGGWMMEPWVTSPAVE